LHFTGQDWDSESSLTHFMFRQLSTTESRWISPDPAGMGAVNPGNPQTWNRYAYVANNPAGAVDPLGLWRSDIFPYAYAKWGYSWRTSLFLDSSGRVFNPFGLDPGFPTDDTVGVVAAGSGGGGVGGDNSSVGPATNCTPGTKGCFNVPQLCANVPKSPPGVSALRPMQNW
jgi:RHS repeat-associated protein